MELEYTKHALDVMDERNIPVEWIERTVSDLALRLPDRDYPEVERFFRAVPEYGNRVLRVAVNTNVATWRVVSVFFDRGMRGRL